MGKTEPCREWIVDYVWMMTPFSKQDDGVSNFQAQPSEVEILPWTVFRAPCDWFVRDHTFYINFQNYFNTINPSSMYNLTPNQSINKFKK